MNPRLWIVVALVVFAAACGTEDAPGVIERQASADADPPPSSRCDEVEAFALGSHAGDDLHAVIDELGRLAAVFDAAAALPHLASWRAAVEDRSSAADAMDAAADLIDAATHAECGVPAFTAMYVSTSFASCFGRAPIDAGSLAPETAACETGISPSFLPCFSTDGGYLPVDCRSGATVMVDAGSWVEIDATG